MSSADRAYLNTRVAVMATQLLDPDTIGRLPRCSFPSSRNGSI
jgi:vacuolar-type H+-ATPase subunit C/Vma6